MPMVKLWLVSPDEVSGTMGFRRPPPHEFLRALLAVQEEGPYGASEASEDYEGHE